MFELTYKDNYHVERTLKYEDYEALMLALSGCVTLPDTFYVTSLTFDGAGSLPRTGRRPLPFSSTNRIFTSKLSFFLSFFLFLLIFFTMFL